MIVTFCGPMGSGKSEAIKELKAFVLPKEVCLVKFAQPIYDMQEMIYNRIKDVYTRPDDFVKDRKLLQWLGTEWGRDSISKTLWVDLWSEHAKSHVKHGRIAACDDVRFDNEAEAVKRLGGVIIRISTTRNGERIDTRSGLSNHASEAGIDSKFVDFEVDNDGTLNEYREKLRKVFTEIFNTKGTY